jgi:hypothetical protein
MPPTIKDPTSRKVFIGANVLKSETVRCEHAVKIGHPLVFVMTFHCHPPSTTVIPSDVLNRSKRGAKMSKTPCVAETDGNIFADLGIDKADEFYARACLGVQVMKLLKAAAKKRRPNCLASTAGNIRAYAREIQPFQSGAVNWIPQ